MDELIADLLTYSQVKSGNYQLKEVEPGKTVNTILNEIQTEIKSKNATVHLNSLPEKVVADPTNFRRVFQNLITNAIKFNQRNGTQVEVSIDGKEDDDFWHFSVADNGIGIEAEYKDKIFLLFRKLHASSVYEGTGIGLPMCRTIVEKHGGKIWFDSELGKGSTFHFTIARNLS
jgi:light-regulated signal transduction histidine kinase (bacteriophytochrome)